MLRDASTYYIDHYLGKEVILNIASLRWANQVFEPTWNARHIESVQLTLKEDLGTGGRGGYFDQYGIIRDVMQNHLLQVVAPLPCSTPYPSLSTPYHMRQVMALIAMEQPPSFVFSQPSGSTSQTTWAEFGAWPMRLALLDLPQKHATWCGFFAQLMADGIGDLFFASSLQLPMVMSPPILQAPTSSQ